MIFLTHDFPQQCGGLLAIILHLVMLRADIFIESRGHEAATGAPAALRNRAIRMVCRWSMKETDDWPDDFSAGKRRQGIFVATCLCRRLYHRRGRHHVRRHGHRHCHSIRRSPRHCLPSRHWSHHRCRLIRHCFQSHWIHCCLIRCRWIRCRLIHRCFPSRSPRHSTCWQRWSRRRSRWRCDRCCRCGSGRSYCSACLRTGAQGMNVVAAAAGSTEVDRSREVLAVSAHCARRVPEVPAALSWPMRVSPFAAPRGHRRLPWPARQVLRSWASRQFGVAAVADSALRQWLWVARQRVRQVARPQALDGSAWALSPVPAPPFHAARLAAALRALVGKPVQAPAEYRRFRSRAPTREILAKRAKLSREQQRTAAFRR